MKVRNTADPIYLSTLLVKSSSGLCFVKQEKIRHFSPTKTFNQFWNFKFFKKYYFRKKIHVHFSLFLQQFHDNVNIYNSLLVPLGNHYVSVINRLASSQNSRLIFCCIPFTFLLNIFKIRRKEKKKEGKFTRLTRIGNAKEILTKIVRKLKRSNASPGS